LYQEIKRKAMERRYVDTIFGVFSIEPLDSKFEKATNIVSGDKYIIPKGMTEREVEEYLETWEEY
jgi:hypothetical protein